jgi:hypothetical protein
MTRVWTIVVAAVTAFLVHSLAGYVEDSSALHERSRDVIGTAEANARRISSTRIDGTWLSAELPKIKSSAVSESKELH